MMSLNKNSHLFVSSNTQYVLPSHWYPSCRPGDSINFSGTSFQRPTQPFQLQVEQHDLQVLACCDVLVVTDSGSIA